jgi:hypothetical protein
MAMWKYGHTVFVRGPRGETAWNTREVDVIMDLR